MSTQKISELKGIFEPLSTIKDTDQRAGLDSRLSTGSSNNDSLIDVGNKPMTASFRLSFPIETYETIVRKPALLRESMATMSSRRTPTVLIVEDEESMRYVLGKTLVNRGYKVLTAADGDQAVRIYQRHKAAIDVVFLDIGLPKLSGRDVLFKIKQENQAAKIVVSSGYFEEDFKSDFERAGIKHFLQKPYQLDHVVQTLQSAIEEKS
jgi:two-component system, cell cycle sensor histidine kinase and response regulator CckA